MWLVKPWWSRLLCTKRREPDHRRPNAALGQRNCAFSESIRGPAGRVSSSVAGRPSTNGHHQRSGRADERRSGADENLAHRLDGTQIRLGGPRKSLKSWLKARWMTPSEADAAARRPSRSSRSPRCDLGAHGRQRRGGLVRTGQTGDLMPSLEQFGHHCRPDVSCRAGDENSHDVLPELAMSGNTTLRPVPGRRPRLVSQYSIPIRHHYSSSRPSGYFSAGSTIIMRT